MATYPTAVKSFTSKLTDDPIEAAHVNDVQEEITAMEGGLLNGLAHSLVPVSDGVHSLGSGSNRWLLNGALLTGAASSYTPLWTNTNGLGNPVIGNGSLTGSFVQVGKLVYFSFIMAMGTTTTLGPPGAGNWDFSMPFPRDGAHIPIFTCTLLDSGVAFHLGGGFPVANASNIHPYAVQAGTPSSVSGFHASFPFVWSVGDVLWGAGLYVKA